MSTPLTPSAAHPVPAVTADQMREVDRLMVDEYGVGLVRMMENAGRALAHLARARFLGGDARGGTVVVLCGTGGNGGGGLVCARRLHGWGADVRVVTAAPDSRFDGVPARQLEIVRRMTISVGTTGDGPLPPAALLIDALLGYSLVGAPRGDSARLIRAANAHGAPVLSLDLPSGVEATSGVVHEPSIRAAATLTLALSKTGFARAAGAGVVGELYLADIGVPPELYAKVGIAVAEPWIFAESDIVRIW